MSGSGTDNSRFGPSLRDVDLPFPPNTWTPCQDGDPEWFFPGPNERKQAARAKGICRDLCPIATRDACLAYAMTHHVQGVWGGLTEKERSRMRGQDR